MKNQIYAQYKYVNQEAREAWQKNVFGSMLDLKISEDEGLIRIIWLEIIGRAFLVTECKKMIFMYLIVLFVRIIFS